MAQNFTDSTHREEDKKKKLNKKRLQKAIQIFRFVLPYKITFFVGHFFLILSTLTALAIPFLAGKLLDVALGNKTPWFSSIYQVGVIFGIILFSQALFSFLRIQLFAKVSENAMSDIRSALYAKIITLQMSFFEKRRVGELTSRITTDVSQLQDVLSYTIGEFFRQIATILIGTSILFAQSTKLTFFMIATFPIMVISAMIFGKFIRKLAKKVQDELAAANTIVEETFQSIQSVKAFTNENYEIGRYKKSLGKVVVLALRVARYRGIFASFIIAVLFGGVMLVLGFGALLVEKGEMLPGELTSFIIYTAFIGGSVGGAGELYGQLQRAVGASERVLEILEEPSEVKIEGIKTFVSLSLKGKVAYRDVRFTYPTRPDIAVLKGINLDIEVGQKIALVGYSGAGKSTIVQLLNRFYQIEQGEIWVDEKNIQDYDITQLRQNIGIVPQEIILFGGTIGENIEYGKPGASQEEIREAARRANALSFIESFPEGLNTLVGERGVKLSGGQKQRVAIARAILKNPAILILDEATSSLDADSEKLVQEALDELMKNRTTIIIAHRLATIRKVDKIYILNEGKIVESGTHEELSILENGIYSNLVKLQFDTEELVREKTI